MWMVFRSQSHGGNPLKLYQWLTSNTDCVSSAVEILLPLQQFIRVKSSDWQRLLAKLTQDLVIFILGLTSNTDCISAAVEILPPVQQFIRVKSSDWQRPLATLTQDLVILILGFTSNTDCISSAIEILSATSRIYQGQQQ